MFTIITYHRGIWIKIVCLFRWRYPPPLHPTRIMCAKSPIRIGLKTVGKKQNEHYTKCVYTLFFIRNQAKALVVKVS